MKIEIPMWRLFLLTIAMLAGHIPAQGQGTITFNAPIPLGNPYVRYQNYYEQGVWFRVVAPPPNTPSGQMLQVDGIYPPSNGSPHMQWNGQPTTEWVVFSMANGSTFGLTSVELGNPRFVQSSVAITFNGFYADGSIVSAMFNTPSGDHSSLSTYYFGSEFASGLTRVEIPSQFWVMDNIVWVPEPSAASLLVAGLLVVTLRRFHQRRRSAPPGAP